MKRFTQLYESLDATTSTNDKVETMVEYFRDAPPEDAAWALFLLTGRKLKRITNSQRLRSWAMERAEIAAWLFDESYAAVGDLAETIALLLDDGTRPARDDTLPLHTWMESRVMLLPSMDEVAQRETVLRWWSELDAREIFILNKLLTGELRVGVSQTLVVRAIAQLANADTPTIEHRLMGEWQPSADFFRRVSSATHIEVAVPSQPYPFCLASPLEQEPASLGAVTDFLAEWKWDGIRAQLVRRNDQTFLWSRGEELISDRFPEILEESTRFPNGTVLDGELLAFHGDEPLSFWMLQRRIGRKSLSAKMLAEAPVSFVAYDVLEHLAQDIRHLPLEERRSRLSTVLTGTHERMRISESVVAASWKELATLRATARDRGVEGLMLKRLDSAYATGRRRGVWWKWKIDPFRIDAVLIYAQAGSGRRANLFTDYTFAVWDGPELVPLAKAYSGLKDEEIRQLDRWIRAHTKDRFGPVRQVEPLHVFELSFEGIRASKRHRSGIAVRFPRIARWRTDKRPEEADTLENVRALIQ